MFSACTAFARPVLCPVTGKEGQGAMQLLGYIKRVPYLADLCRRIQLVWVDGGYRGDATSCQYFIF